MRRAMGLGVASAAALLLGSAGARAQVAVLATSPATLHCQITGEYDLAASAMTSSSWPGCLAAEHGKSTARLLRIDISGSSVEVWRLRATRHLPTFRLSVSGQGEIVVSLVVHDRSEVALLDAAGRASRSDTLTGKLLAPVIATSSVLSWPFERKSKGNADNLELRSEQRAEMAAGICGARWLRRHLDASALGRMGDPRDCEESDHDDDHANDD